MKSKGQVPPAPKPIDWSAADEFIKGFAASTAHRKPKGGKDPRPRPPSHQEKLLEKHKEQSAIDRRARDARKTRRERYRKDHAPYRRFERWAIHQAKSGQQSIDEYGLLDTDYTDIPAHFKLHTLPEEVRRECVELFRGVIRRAWKNYEAANGSDWIEPFRKMPADWKNDLDEFSQLVMGRV